MNRRPKTKMDPETQFILTVLFVTLAFSAFIAWGVLRPIVESTKKAESKPDKPKYYAYDETEKPNNIGIFVVVDVIGNEVYLMEENDLDKLYVLLSDGENTYTPSQVYSIRYKDTYKSGNKNLKYLEGVKAATLFEEESNTVIPDSAYRKIYNDPEKITYVVDSITNSGIKIQLLDSNDFPNEFLNDFKIYKAPNKLNKDYSLGSVYNYEELEPTLNEVFYEDTIEDSDNDKVFNYKAFKWSYYYGRLEPGYYYIELLSEDTQALVYFIVKEDGEAMVHDFQTFQRTYSYE